jgi:hypothetical protein
MSSVTALMVKQAELRLGLIYPVCFVQFNPFRSYVGPHPTLWFSCSWRFSWSLTLSNPVFLPPAYSPALIYFGRKRGWWITCNYPTVLKEKYRNRKSTTCAICWLKSVLHEEKRREQENHNVGLFVQHYDFPVPNAVISLETKTFPWDYWVVLLPM